MENTNRVFLAALAGLLHDVGKFAQRGGAQVGRSWDDETKKELKYQHALHTWHFIDKYLPADFGVSVLAAYHHRPKNANQMRIRLADQLSAGERDSGQERDDSDRKEHPKQLHPIFTRLKLKDGDKYVEHPNPDGLYLPLKPLAREVIFPTEKPLGKDDWQAYESMWTDFCNEAEALKSLPLEAYLEAMQALLQRYTWCVPSAYFNAVPDVSLYDHSRMTAALAVCLSDFDDDKIEALNRDWQAQSGQTWNEPVALLVGGDISGVQDFIYTITNKGATSALRGRSFYLQLLTEAAARFVLRELGLPYTNLIYGGGGNFYILARASDKEKLANARQKLSRILYKHHQGDLYVAIEGIPLQAKEFMRPKEKNPDGSEKRHPLSDKWSELAQALAEVKNRRFADLEADELRILFRPQGHGGNEEAQCQVCGREHPDTKVIKKGSEDEGVRKCPACRSYEALGEELRKAQFIGWNFLAHPENVSALTGDEISSGYEEVLRDLGFEIETGSGDEVDRALEKVQDFSRIWALSDDAFEHARLKTSGKVLVRRLLVNVTPIITTEEIRQLRQKGVGDLPDENAKSPIKPFSALAHQSQGITRLGVFRADVDNLGKLFAEGLGEHATLSRIASLSFAISLFFEGWVGVLAERRNAKRKKEHPEWGDALYAIYSGGDDLFFVGSWDEVVEFAWQVNEDLKKYTGDHPGIHLSGGMALVTEKYPLAKAAKDAEKAESAAKSLTWWDESGKKREKNVFSFLGQPLPWSEFQNARELKQRLEKLDDSKRTAVIRKLLMNYALYARAEKKRRDEGKDKKQDGKPQTLYGPWNWRILYLLRRTFGKPKPESRETEEEGLTRDFHVLPTEARQPDYAHLDWVGVAARWVELEDR